MESKGINILGLAKTNLSWCHSISNDLHQAFIQRFKNIHFTDFPPTTPSNPTNPSTIVHAHSSQEALPQSSLADTWATSKPPC
jgi:hypothetical protein